MSPPPAVRSVPGLAGDELHEPSLPAFWVENPDSKLKDMPFMQPYAPYMSKVSMCKTEDPRKKARVLRKTSCIWSNGIVPDLQCTSAQLCAFARKYGEGVHDLAMSGREQGEYSRGDDLEQNIGMRPCYVRRLVQDVLKLAPAEAIVGRRWVLELYCFSKSNAPLCKRLGVAHVAISGQVERIRGKDYGPDLLNDLALVFAELERPLDFLIERALAHLRAREARVRGGVKYTREGLILVTVAPRCTTYANMGGCNYKQGKFVTRMPKTNKPRTGGVGAMAVIDDTANERMMAEIFNLPVLCCVPCAPTPLPATSVAGTRLRRIGKRGGV